MNKTTNILITEPSADYELLDSGDGEKLERFGKVVLSRPDPQALWAKRLDITEWKKADGVFSREETKGGWTIKPNTPNSWPIEFVGLKFTIKPTPFKHVGLFPEQAENWKWMRNVIGAKDDASANTVSFPRKRESSVAGNGANDSTLDSRFRGNDKQESGGQIQNRDVEILNLFGYTGGASLTCAQAGAKVVHVDGSKAAVTWARENAELSGLDKKPIRWILEDARSFVKREIKRERKYDGIIMDPPAFGHGPENEVWKIEEDFLPLVEDCLKLLSDKPLFFLINGYASGYSALAYENILLKLKEKLGGDIETGELAVQESGIEKSKIKMENDNEKMKKAEMPLTINYQLIESEALRAEWSISRLLPCGIFARWSTKL